MKKALGTGALKLSGPAVGQFFNGENVRSFFDKTAVPLTITYGGENQANVVLSKLAEKVLFKQGIEGYGKKLLLGQVTPPPPVIPKTTAGQDYQLRVLADATLTNKYLLHLSFVDMQNGIGRGWG
jgi:hypothetical protein